MENSEKNIQLTFSREFFEEIYFKDNKKSIVLSPDLRKEIVTLVIVGALFLFSIIYSRTTDKYAWLIVIFLIFLIFTSMLYCIKAWTIIKWKRNVSKFINENAKVKSHSLILTSESFSLVQDCKEEIQRWSAINHVEISNDYVILTGSNNYIFPRKSMRSDDYDDFIVAIKKHIKNGI